MILLYLFIIIILFFSRMTIYKPSQTTEDNVTDM